jgi:hypothetical protein
LILNGILKGEIYLKEGKLLCWNFFFFETFCMFPLWHLNYWNGKYVLGKTQKCSPTGHWIVQASWLFTKSSTWTNRMVPALKEYIIMMSENYFVSYSWRVLNTRHAFIPWRSLFPSIPSGHCAQIIWIQFNISLRKMQLESLLKSDSMRFEVLLTFITHTSLTLPWIWTMELMFSKYYWRGYMCQAGWWNGDLGRTLDFGWEPAWPKQKGNFIAQMFPTEVNKGLGGHRGSGIDWRIWVPSSTHLVSSPFSMFSPLDLVARLYYTLKWIVE